MSDEYLVGQRVIYSNEICVVCHPPQRKEREIDSRGSVWVMRPAGYESCVSLSNVKPLPGGQL